MQEEISSSPAFRALTPAGRRVWQVILDKIGDGDSCRISRDTFRQIDGFYVLLPSQMAFVTLKQSA